MSTIAEKLKTTYLGLAGLTTSIRQLLSVGAKEVTSQEINSKLDDVAKEEAVKEVSSKLDNLNVDVDLSGVAKQGDNPEATNSKILDEVRSKLTPLEAVLTELNNGKQEMVDALATKSVQSSTDKTLSQIAQDITKIQTTEVTIDGGELYGEKLLGTLDDSIQWNLYKVMEDILADVRFVQYGGIIIAEYGSGDEKIELKGVGTGGAYYTSDGEIIEEDMAGDNAYVWKDINAKANRWVAYLLKSEYSDFVPSVYSYRYHIGRKVGKITQNSTYGPIEIVCLDGNCFGTNPTSVINTPSTVILRNIYQKEVVALSQNKTALRVYTSGSYERTSATSSDFFSINASYIKFERIDYYNVNTLTNGNLSAYLRIDFPKGFVLDGTATWANGGGNIIQYRSNNKILEVRGLTKIVRGLVHYNIYPSDGNYLEEVRVPDLEECYGNIIYLYKNNDTVYKVLRRVFAPKLIKGKLSFFGAATTKILLPSLIDVEIGYGYEGTIDLASWNPVNVIADDSQKTILLDNIHNHIADRVKDFSGTDTTHIATFSQEIRDILRPETEALFASKNWDIAPAKSV